VTTLPTWRKGAKDLRLGWSQRTARKRRSATAIVPAPGRPASCSDHCRTPGVYFPPAASSEATHRPPAATSNGKEEAERPVSTIWIGLSHPSEGPIPHTVDCGHKHSRHNRPNARRTGARKRGPGGTAPRDERCGDGTPSVCRNVADVILERPRAGPRQRGGLPVSGCSASTSYRDPRSGPCWRNDCIKLTRSARHTGPL
jgi:hypothetical protein